MRALGIDTSNYTCSTAVYDTATRELVMSKRLLPTPLGSVGLRQSQAVFEQVKLIGSMMQNLFSQTEAAFDVVGVSTRPRAVEGSYMPCFLVGEAVAQSAAAASGVPLARYSHQQGHIAAALFSAGRLSWLEGSRFLAFHVSGGTTDCLLVEAANNRITHIDTIGHSLDLKAGQAIDRVGVSMGLSFPAGVQLERLSDGCQEEVRRAIRPYSNVKGTDCCLSGLQNLCEKLSEDGASREEVACFCLLSVRDTIEKMLLAAFEQVGRLPVLFAGGVMSNRLLREYFTSQYGGAFAEPQLSSDNAGGVAVLAAGERL